MKSKIGIVIAREYLTRIRKKSFILMTILAPLFFVFLSILPVLLMSLDSDSDTQEVAIIDRTGQYATLFESTDQYRFVLADKTAEEYKSAGEEQPITALLVINQDLLQDPKAISLFSFKQLAPGLEDYINQTLSAHLSEQKIASYNIENLDQIIRESKVSIRVSTYKWSESGAEASSSSTVASLMGIGLALLSYMFILTYGSMMLQSVLEEKKTRIMEVIISSIKPFDLMMGKIIGIGLLGLTQIAIWCVLTAGLYFVAQFAFLGSLYSPEMLAQAQQAGTDPDSIQAAFEIFSVIQGVNFFEIVTMFVLLFVGGFLIYSSVLAALGSSVSSDEDAGQLMLPVTLLIMVSFYVGMACANNPEGQLAYWASLFPLTAPIVMMVRLPYDVPLWQEALSIALLYASFVGITYISAKIYRVGVLMYGKKPSLKELWRWTKYK